MADRHAITIRESDYSGSVYAECLCGWSQVRATISRAKDAGDEHLQAAAAQEHAPTKIERLRVRPADGTSPFTVLVEIEHETDQLIRGHEVDSHGDWIEGRDFDDRVRIIDKQLITRRTPMSLNLHYNELEQVQAPIIGDAGSVRLWHLLAVSLLVIGAFFAWPHSGHKPIVTAGPAAAAVPVLPTTAPPAVTTATAPPTARPSAPPVTSRPVSTVPHAAALPTSPPTTRPAPATTAPPVPAACMVLVAASEAPGSTQPVTVRQQGNPHPDFILTLLQGNGSGGPRWEQAGITSGGSWTGSYTVDTGRDPAGTVYHLTASFRDGSSCASSFTVS